MHRSRHSVVWVCKRADFYVPCLNFWCNSPAFYPAQLPRKLHKRSVVTLLGKNNFRKISCRGSFAGIKLAVARTRVLYINPFSAFRNPVLQLDNPWRLFGCTTVVLPIYCYLFTIEGRKIEYHPCRRTFVVFCFVIQKSVFWGFVCKVKTFQFVTRKVQIKHRLRHIVFLLSQCCKLNNQKKKNCC